MTNSGFDNYGLAVIFDITPVQSGQWRVTDKLHRS